MKKSFTLLITIFVLILFSYLSLIILQTKSLSNTNIQNQYLYIQANNHKEFLKSYINSINLTGIKHLDIENKFFDIYSTIKKEEEKYKINIYVKSKEFDISIHEKIIK
jgi:hypothetical protein